MKRRHFLHTTGLAALVPHLGAAESPLAEHVIDSLETRKIKVPWPRHVGRNATKGIHGHGYDTRIAILKTKQGATGWGQLQGDPKQLREQVIGRRIGELIHPTMGILDDRYRPIDIALHDLAAVTLGVPVWKMLGAEKPQLSPVYSGMIYIDDLDPKDNPAGIDLVLKNARWDRDYGYRQLKVKIGRGHQWMPPAEGLARDIEVMKALHKELPECELLIDGNNGFTFDTITAFLEGIPEIPLFWIEEPFHETVAEWRKLRDWLVANGREKTFRADGEAKPDFGVLDTLERDHTLNMRLNDICGYGFTRWRKLMPQLKTKGIAASPHTWGSSLKTVYTAHLAAATGNVPTIEGVTPHAEAEADFGDNKIIDGKFSVSSAPGFGIAIK